MSDRLVKIQPLQVSAPADHQAQADFQIDLIESWDAFCALRPSWNAVYERDPESHFFLSWGWLAEFFRNNPSRWRVFAVQGKGRGSDYVGFFPAKYRVRWSKSTKSFQSEVEAGGRLGWSEYTGFLCDPSYEEQVLTALAEKLAALPWTKLSVCYEPSQRRADLFMKAFPKENFRSRYKDYRINKGQTDNLICPRISLRHDYENYLLECLSSNTRQKIRRFTRKFIDTGELRITQTTPENFDRNVEILLDQWQQKWSSWKGADNARSIAKMYRKMLQTGLKLDALQLPVLWRGDTPLGALGSIADTNTKHLCFIIAGRDESVSDANTGLLLHSHSIKWAIENGIETYDFGHGDEAYKYSFGAVERRVNYFSIRRKNPADSDFLDPLNIPEVMQKAGQSSSFDAVDKIASANRQTLLLSGQFGPRATDVPINRNSAAGRLPK